MDELNAKEQDAVVQTDVEEVAEAENTKAEAVADESSVEAVSGEAGEEATDKPKKKGIKAMIAYIQAHEDLRQMVLFFLFSLICGASQFVTNMVFKYALEAVPELGTDYPFHWFVFNHPSTGDFIGFLLGAIIGQVMTFVLNRKKTFKATNNVVIAAIAYAITAILIIILQTYLGGVVSTACTDAYKAANGGADPTGFISFLITITGMLAGGLTALVLCFLANKFFIMRNWNTKKSKKAKEGENAEGELVEGETAEGEAVENAVAEVEAGEVKSEDTAEVKSEKGQPQAEEEAQVEAAVEEVKNVEDAAPKKSGKKSKKAE